MNVLTKRSQHFLMVEVSAAGWSSFRLMGLAFAEGFGLGSITSVKML